MKYLVLLSLIIFTSWSFAHEGHMHNVPSSVQPLHGGVLQAAEHIHGKSGKHNHVEAIQRGYYFEVLYTKAAFKVYLHKLKEGSKTELQNLKPSANIKLVEVEQINPRQKKSKKALTIQAKEDHWQVTPVQIKGKRTLLNLSLLYKEENFQATVQVERK